MISERITETGSAKHVNGGAAGLQEMLLCSLANKHEFKNLFLDAIGEPQSSPRRNSANGIEFKYTFNADGPKNRKIDVFVLDERYERDSLPCGIRREWFGHLRSDPPFALGFGFRCEDVLKAEPEEPDHDYIWCQDFLQTGGPLGAPSRFLSSRMRCLQVSDPAAMQMTNGHTVGVKRT